jgi:hypothetical protein
VISPFDRRILRHISYGIITIKKSVFATSYFRERGIGRGSRRYLDLRG